VYVYNAQGQLAAEYYSGTAQDALCQPCYLTADHLGSTRLVSDGHTVVSKRYDYRPFGEDIPAGIGGRSTALGYVVADPTTIEFTGKQRDSDTVSSTTKGLDYFGARYMSSAQGRFTSPDPLSWLGWQNGNDEGKKKFQVWISNPQNLDMYAYVRNNPLTHTDPTGMYACTGTQDECQKFKEALAVVRKADQNLKAGSSERKRLDAVLGFCGKDDGRGPQIKFADLNADQAVGETSTVHGQTTITFDANALSAMQKVGQGETVAHEGTHGVDDHRPGAGAGQFWSFYDTEYHAYQSECYVDMGLGKANQTDQYPAWDPGMSYSQHVTNMKRDAYSNAMADCQNGAVCGP
jgi:RHS repeat-associated protein